MKKVLITLGLSALAGCSPQIALIPSCNGCYVHEADIEAADVQAVESGEADDERKE